jgi:peptidoglycan hydrolase CwlO-like protein
MMRGLIGGAVVALIAIVAFFMATGEMQQTISDKDSQISALSQQVAQLAAENERLKSALAKVEAEQERLARQNEEMRRTLATIKATGKLPASGLPPK